MLKFALIAACALVTAVSAYSAGAPTAVCDDMTPKHPVAPQSTAIPYKIQVSKSQVAPGADVDIKIVGKKFKGFLLQVREGDKAVGSFKISPDDKYFKAISCHGTQNSAATHKNSNDKSDAVLKWTAPKKAGAYQVFVTVAEDGGTFWVRKPTEIIKVN